MTRALLRVIATEPVGPYTLVRLARGPLEPGRPGQFFMVEAPERLLPRPFSLCLAPPGELGFLVACVGPGTRAIASVERGDELHVLGPLGNGFDLEVERPLIVGGGIGIAPFPFLVEKLKRSRAVLGFRDAHQAEAAALVPGAEVVVDPVLVTDALPAGSWDVLACGPEQMLVAVRNRFGDAQLAWEAPMACGFGACYGCVVEMDGHYRRLCVDGPVLRAA